AIGDIYTGVAPSGVVENARAPRQGPNHFQNFPVIVTTADSRLRGWLGGSTPDTTFRIDVFASAAFHADGTGEAQEFLGSIQVRTDDLGQASFDAPFQAPPGMPVVTATATDSAGNSSVVSALRQAVLDFPPASLRAVAARPLGFSAASGDGIAIE